MLDRKKDWEAEARSRGAGLSAPGVVIPGCRRLSREGVARTDGVVLPRGRRLSREGAGRIDVGLEGVEGFGRVCVEVGRATGSLEVGRGRPLGRLGVESAMLSKLTRELLLFTFVEAESSTCRFKSLKSEGKVSCLSQKEEQRNRWIKETQEERSPDQIAGKGDIHGFQSVGCGPQEMRQVGEPQT